MKDSSSASASTRAIAMTVPRLVSRDEMNLAEFPLAVLSTRTDPNIITLEFQDNIRGKNGELIDRNWIITGADKFGLPTASDEEVLLGLLKLSVDDELKSRKIFFTRYELMKILRWPTEGRNYSRLQKALDRLSGVRIKATNAFYDNETKTHSTKNFGIIDGYELNDGRDGGAHKQSFFTWNEVLFKSFQAGFIKTLDLDFYLDLRSAVTKRLYRYLDKHFWYKSRVQNDLFVLAHEKLGVSRNYRFVSSLRQQLDPAIQELIERGFLGGCEYIQKGKGADVVFYAASAKGKSLKAGDAHADRTVVDEGDESVLRRQVLRMLDERGLAEKQAKKLVGGFSLELLQRAAKIIEYFDTLCASGSSQVIKSPVGFLYRAVENPLAFKLPGDKAVQSAFSFAQKREPAVPREDRATKQRDNDESAYLTARKRRIECLRNEVEAGLLQSITKEVEAALGNIRSYISPDRFSEVLRHGVDEKLAKLFALPDFDEWQRGRKE